MKETQEEERPGPVGGRRAAYLTDGDPGTGEPGRWAGVWSEATLHDPSGEGQQPGQHQALLVRRMWNPSPGSQPHSAGPSPA